MRRNLRRIVTAILIVSFVIALRPQVAHAQSVTVNNQKELNEALSNPDAQKIVIESDKELKLKIKDKYVNENSKSVTVNAPQATVSVSANINTVTIADASSVKIKQAVSTLEIDDTDLSLNVSAKGSVESIKILADESKIQLTNQGSVQKISATGTDYDISVQQKGTLNKIVMKNPGKVDIGGSSDQETKISVKKGALGSEISSSVPLALTSKAEVSLELKEGAEKSSVTLKGENAGVSLNNQTNGKITITDSDGEKVDVKSHETAGAGVLTSPKEDKKEEQKQEAAVIYLPTAPSHPADEITNVILDGVECTATTKFDTQGRKTETRYVSKANNKLMKVETFNTSGTIANEDTYFYMAPSDTPSDISINYIKMTSGSAIEGKLNLGLYAYSNDYPNGYISYAKYVIDQSVFYPDSFEMLLRVSEVYPANNLSPLMSSAPITGDIASAINTTLRDALTPQAGATQFEHLTLTFNSSTHNVVLAEVELCPLSGGFSSGNITETQVYDYSTRTLSKYDTGENKIRVAITYADNNTTPISRFDYSYNAISGYPTRTMVFEYNGQGDPIQTEMIEYDYSLGYLTTETIKTYNLNHNYDYYFENLGEWVYKTVIKTYNADGEVTNTSDPKYFNFIGDELPTPSVS